MKQHISMGDLSQLTPNQVWALKKLLRVPNSMIKIVIPFKCTIGKMIEILHDKTCDIRIESAGENWFVDDNLSAISYDENNNEYPELCDALWANIKKILQED